MEEGVAVVGQGGRRREQQRRRWREAGGETLLPPLLLLFRQRGFGYLSLAAEVSQRLLLQLMTMMSTPKAEPRRARPFSFCFFFQYGFSRGGERKNKGQGRFTSRSKHRHVNALKTTPVFVEMLLAASPFPRATAFQLFRPSEHRPDRANAIISRLKLNNSRISRLCPPRRRSRKKKKTKLASVFGHRRRRHQSKAYVRNPRRQASRATFYPKCDLHGLFHVIKYLC